MSNLLLDGTLVQLEDLVFHDAGLDARPPPGTTLDVGGLLSLVGRSAPKTNEAELSPLASETEYEDDDAWG